jgi:integrase/recombinase XerD
MIILVMNGNKNKQSRGRKLGSGNGSARPLTDNEVRQLFASIYGKHGHRNRALVSLLFHCGMRCGEASGLSIGQLRAPNGKVRDSIVIAGVNMKGKVSHRYYVSNVGKLIIGEYLNLLSGDDSEPLFPSPKTGKLMTANSVSRLVKNIFRNAGIDDASSHSGRSTFSRKLLDCGVGIEVISKCLAHKNLSTTISYLGNLQPNAQNAVSGIQY